MLIDNLTLNLQNWSEKLKNKDFFPFSTQNRHKAWHYRKYPNLVHIKKWLFSRVRTIIKIK